VSTFSSATAHLLSSTARFPDGSQYRFEIPSVEGPACLRAVLEEADRLEVSIERVSQGSGVFLHTDTELDEMAYVAADAGIEVSLFARPTAGWELSASARSAAGGALAAACYGVDGLARAVADVQRAASHGFRSVLISDVGLLAEFGRLRGAGALPADMQAKVSVMLPIANPATAQVLVELGADTLNLPTDLGLAQIAEIRRAVDAPLDVYVEAPDNLGGFVRHHDIPELIRIAAPVHVKFGLRNAPDVYPAGTHLAQTTTALSRERVRRARLGWELLQRSGYEAIGSSPGAVGLAIPVIGASART
jgi:hypothetical protein